MKHRWKYPEQWEQMAWECKQQANWQCEWCGVAHGEEAVSERTGQCYTVYLAACHLDHDPWNEHPRLAALCPSCHMRYDWSWQQRQRRVELERMRHQVWLNVRYYAHLDLDDDEGSS